MAGRTGLVFTALWYAHGPHNGQPLLTALAQLVTWYGHALFLN